MRQWLAAVAVVVCAGLGAAHAQTITEYAMPTAASGPTGIVVGPDGALWFTEQAGNNIGRVSTAGVVTEYPIPTANSAPTGITAGSDGALWFTEMAGDKIGRITTAGAITEYSGFTGNPTGITAGPDGALWFFAGLINSTGGGFPLAYSYVGRITTAGVITQYLVRSGDLDTISSIIANNIVTGPDGALWFDDNILCGIGRITTAGVFSYPVGGGCGHTPEPSNGFTVGPDGAFWFTVNGGSIETLSNGSESVVADILNTPVLGAITTGPDGALWFTDLSNSKIGRVTTAGAVGQYPTPTASSQPIGIVTGPDGALWFTESAGNKIGTFSLAVLTVATSGNGQVTSSAGGIACSATSSQCTATLVANTPATLTASAAAGWSFSGWSGGGCTGTVPCQLTLAANETVTATFAQIPSYVLAVVPAGTGSGAVTSDQSGISCGATCTASYLSGTQVTLTAMAASGSTFAGWSGGGCGGVATCTVTLAANTQVTASFVQNSSAGIGLYAAVLPLSRSVSVGATATAFASVVNAGSTTASTCTIAPSTTIASGFSFQTTNPTTNAVTGTLNGAVDIAAGASQSFLIAFTPTAAFNTTDVALTFGCANASLAPVVAGVDMLQLAASTTAVPDIVALAASADAGYVDISSIDSTGDFAVATINLGSAAQITASVDTGTANLPVTVTLCETDPTSGACLATPTANVTITIAANATPTFGVFLTGSAAVADLPGLNRVFVRFTDQNGVLRGETSVAARTK